MPAQNNYKLMTPGPVPLPDWVLKILAQPVLHHRTNEFEAILERTLSRMQALFLTKQPCFVLTATGTGGMEASLVNCIKKGDEVLSVDAGKFGQRWHEMAQLLGYRSHHLAFKWGEDIDVTLIEKALKENPGIKAILCQASETSTGALLPIEKISRLTRNTDTLLIVDAVTGLGAFPLPMDEWGIDVLITGSQKALMLPTGLTLMSASQKAWKQIEKIAPSQAYYWNLIEERKANEKTQTRFSSAVTLIRALEGVLEYIEDTGLEKIFSLHSERADHFRSQVLKNGVRLFPKTPSPSLSCILLPDGVDSSKVQALLQEKFKIVVMGGQDQLKGKVLRIGHMGDISLKDLTETADAIHSVLNTISSGG
jgi:aspartate aminotransferase-like enzyme